MWQTTVADVDVSTLLREPIRPGMEIACRCHKIHHKIDYKGS